MATLVTGGTGFVGANIVKCLAQTGHDVICFDVNGPDQLTRNFMEDVSSKVSYVQGDILDRGMIDRLGAEHAIDKIVHAAVFTVNRVELETQRSRDVIAINVEGTANLLELARALKVGRFVYVSSGAVYGSAATGDQTLNEDAPPVPLNLYGITKYASELLTRRYGELHGISTASVRLSTPYGPMERVTGHRAVMSVFHQWTGQALRGGSITVDDMDQGRDFTYVADIGDGIRTVLDATTLRHGLYNLTAGTWVTYREILDELIKLTPNTPVIETGQARSEPTSEGPPRGPLSGHRLFQDLRWTPKFDLAAGMADYLKWRRDSSFLE
ncbi:MAG: NAD(P)-dependent oxidoreductase [Chloroflexi bacterium]|nr:NAD(P)-dependent oxidoreductase [Chloroflexota bacterium]